MEHSDKAAIQPPEGSSAEPAAPPVVTTHDFEPEPASPAPTVSDFEPVPAVSGWTPTPPSSTPLDNHGLPGGPDVTSQAVVRVLSPRGIEYVFLTIALIVGAIALAGALISMVNGHFGFDVLSLPVAMLIVSVPVFALLFLRQKKAELQNPDLKYESSKRRATQFTQIASFVVAFFTLIGYVAAILAALGGKFHGSMLKTSLDVLVVLLVAAAC